MRVIDNQVKYIVVKLYNERAQFNLRVKDITKLSKICKTSLYNYVGQSLRGTDFCKKSKKNKKKYDSKITLIISKFIL